MLSMVVMGVMLIMVIIVVMVVKVVLLIMKKTFVLEAVGPLITIPHLPLCLHTERYDRA